jgi:hypothetical protein
VTSPYTLQPLDALMAAQTSVGLVLGALLWLRRLRPWIATVLLLLAIGLVVVAPIDGVLLSSIGFSIGPLHTKRTLRTAAALATLAAAITRRRMLAVTAVVGEASLWLLTSYIEDSDWELAAAHLALFGLLVGVHLRTLAAGADSRQPSFAEAQHPVWIDDVAAFLVGAVAGAVVCRLVLHGWTNSGDEWANTYQAALFAKLRAYGSIPECPEAFRSVWVFQYMGRSFAQYTPGWPYFRAPFVALRVPWLAGPASLGLLAAGASRLGRRAAAGFSPGTPPPSAAHVRAAGRFTALAILLSATVLINGGSRYPHVFVAGTYAWAMESLFTIATAGLSLSEQWKWGATLGISAALMIAARPGDGATLGVGLFAYFVYAVFRQRIGRRAVAGAAIPFGVISVLTLVILRLQIGRWFATGYSLTSLDYPWAKIEWSLPKPSEYRSAIPLAIGAYGWWPCSPAVGLAGIAALRGRAQRMGFVFVCGFVPFAVLYTLLEFGRGFDFGYGPRYTLPSVLAMAVGTGVVLSHLWTAARAPATDVAALHVGGPATLALGAVIIGVARIAPLLYPPAYWDVVWLHNGLHEAIARDALHDAVVFGGPGLNNTDPMDLTENMPLDLYPNQDVIIALDRGPDVVRCVRELYPQRLFYRAVPGPIVKLVPF